MSRPRARGKFLARAGGCPATSRLPVGADPATGDVDLRQGTHRRPSHDAAEAVEGFRFNVAVARMMELVNATRKAIDTGLRRRPTRPCARRSRRSRSCCRWSAPYTAEEMWARLGHEPSVALAGWPDGRPGAAGRGVGDVRRPDRRARCGDRLEVPPDIGEDELRELALAAESVQRALDGRGVRTVIVRAAEAGQHRPGVKPAGSEYPDDP